MSTSSPTQVRSVQVQTVRAGAFEIAAASLPCDEEGGDWVQVRVQDPDQVNILLADASGHGRRAASTLRAFKSVANRIGSNPEAAMLEINDLMIGCLTGIDFVAVTHLSLNTQTGVGRLINAGNPRPMQMDRESIAPVDACGIPLGIFPSRMLPSCSVHSIAFLQGQKILLASDGVLDARNDRDEMFGEGELSAILAANAEAPASELVRVIWDALLAFTAGPLQDDATLVVVEPAGPSRARVA